MSWFKMFEIDRNSAGTATEILARLQAETDLAEELAERSQEEIQEFLDRGWITLEEDKIAVWAEDMS